MNITQITTTDIKMMATVKMIGNAMATAATTTIVTNKKLKTSYLMYDSHLIIIKTFNATSIIRK